MVNRKSVVPLLLLFILLLGPTSASATTTNIVEDAVLGAKNVTSLSDKWVVPQAPTTNDGQTILLYSEVKAVPGCCWIMAVLQWGSSPYTGGGNFWMIYARYISAYGANDVHSTEVQVSVGDMISASMNSNAGIWTITIADSTASTSSALTTTSTMGGYFAYPGILEVRSVQTCSDYPPNSPTTFSNIQLYNNSLLVSSPNWNPEINVRDGCGEQVLINSPSSVSLYFQPVTTTTSTTTTSTISYSYVGASSSDSSAVSNVGVRTTITVISTPIASGSCLSFWIADDSSTNIWGQVGYYICGSSTPVAFYQIWNLNTNTVLNSGTTSLTTVTRTFSMTFQSGTTWAFALDNVVFGTYDIGSSISSSSYPVQTLSEESSTAIFSFPLVQFSTVMQIMKSGSWQNVTTANEPYGCGASSQSCWGIQGRLQNSALQNNQMTVGGTLSSVASGSVLWLISPNYNAYLVLPTSKPCIQTNYGGCTVVSSVAVNPTMNVGFEVDFSTLSSTVQSVTVTCKVQTTGTCPFSSISLTQSVAGVWTSTSYLFPLGSYSVNGTYCSTGCTTNIPLFQISGTVGGSFSTTTTMPFWSFSNPTFDILLAVAGLVGISLWTQRKKVNI